MKRMRPPPPTQVRRRGNMQRAGTEHVCVFYLFSCWLLSAWQTQDFELSNNYVLVLSAMSVN